MEGERKVRKGEGDRLRRIKRRVGKGKVIDLEGKRRVRKGEGDRLGRKKRRVGKRMDIYMTKNGPGPVMVSDTLCPAVHILGT